MITMRRFRIDSASLGVVDGLLIRWLTRFGVFVDACRVGVARTRAEPYAISRLFGPGTG